MLAGWFLNSLRSNAQGAVSFVWFQRTGLFPFGFVCFSWEIKVEKQTEESKGRKRPCPPCFFNGDNVCLPTQTTKKESIDVV